MLTINGINTPIKTQILSNWIKTQAPTKCCQQEMHIEHKKELKVKGQKKMYHVNTNKKESWSGFIKYQKRQMFRTKTGIKDTIS